MERAGVKVADGGAAALLHSEAAMVGRMRGTVSQNQQGTTGVRLLASPKPLS